MKLYDKNEEILNIALNTAELNLDDVQADCLDCSLIMVPYQDKQLLKNLPIDNIESASFSINTSKNTEIPRIQFDVVFNENDIYGREMQTFDAEYDPSEQLEIQNILLQTICSLVYSAKMYKRKNKSLFRGSPFGFRKMDILKNGLWSEANRE